MHRTLPADSELVRAIAVLARAAQDAVDVDVTAQVFFRLVSAAAG